jgi:hypothetical protein
MINKKYTKKFSLKPRKKLVHMEHGGVGGRVNV